jgi:indolepyruvate ferredoxin oxidoreductase beta subunit
LIPNGKANVVIGFEPIEALRVLTVYGNPETVIIVNPHPIYPINVTSGDEKTYPESETVKKSLESLSKKVYYISATEKAIEMGSPILGNMIMIGAFLELNLVPLETKEFREILSMNFNKERFEMNLLALEEGGKMVRQAL